MQFKWEAKLRVSRVIPCHIVTIILCEKKTTIFRCIILGTMLSKTGYCYAVSNNDVQEQSSYTAVSRLVYYISGYCCAVSYSDVQEWSSYTAVSRLVYYISGYCCAVSNSDVQEWPSHTAVSRLVYYMSGYCYAVSNSYVQEWSSYTAVSRLVYYISGYCYAVSNSDVQEWSSYTAVSRLVCSSQQNYSFSHRSTRYVLQDVVLYTCKLIIIIIMSLFKEEHTVSI